LVRPAWDHDLAGLRVEHLPADIPKHERAALGDLDITPVLPMDRGDRWVWASAPWRRGGPPVRDIP
jgi:hypothetical protein